MLATGGALRPRPGSGNQTSEGGPRSHSGISTRVSMGWAVNGEGATLGLSEEGEATGEAGLTKGGELVACEGSPIAEWVGGEKAGGVQP
jgi:hypothetical protein